MKMSSGRWALALLVLLGAAASSWWSIGGAVGIAESQLPPFPEWPEPASSLTADDRGVIYYETSSPYDFDILLRARPLPVRTTGRGTLLMPSDASAAVPVPAVVLVHGSGGITPGREMEAGRFLVDHGIAAFVLDYYAPRGITEHSGYMQKVLAVTEFDATADAYGALAVLSTHPAIDPERIGVMGFSYGGMAVRIAMDERVRQAIVPELRGFAAFVDTYGPCFQDWGTTATNGAPLLTLRGTEDASNELAACAEREAELRALGVEVDVRIYEGAGHAWESSSPRRLSEESPYVSGCTVRYDERGHSWIGEQSIVDGEPDDSRAERVLMRISSGGPLADCVGEGYVIGRDDETAARARRAYLAFFERAFGLATSGRSKGA